MNGQVNNIKLQPASLAWCRHNTISHGTVQLTRDVNSSYIQHRNTHRTRLCSKSKNLRQDVNLNQKWSGIRNQISVLIRFRIRMSAGLLPKCCGFITLSASVTLPSVMKSAGDCMRNTKKSQKNPPISGDIWETLRNLKKIPLSVVTSGTAMRNLYPRQDHQQKSISSSAR